MGPLFTETILRSSLYIGDLNSNLVQHSDPWERLAFQMLGTMVVHQLVNKKVFRPPFEYQSAIQIPGIIVPSK